MKKDAFYFPHFANARHDRKLKRVQKELGLEGYAIYFQLLEILREQLDFKYPIQDIDLLADEIGTSEPKVKTIIYNYDLFTIEDSGVFFSLKQIVYLQPYIEKTDRARIAARKRWDSVNDANAMQMQCVGNASAMQVKESKVNKSKVNIPSETEFLDFAIEETSKAGLDFSNLKYTIRAKYNAWVDEGWKDGNGNDIKNWKSKFKNTLPYLKPIQTNTPTNKIVLK